MTRTKEDIIQILSDHKEDLDRLHVKSLALFGSAARGEQKPDSDIDFWVDFADGATLQKYVDLMEYLENKLNKKIDVVTKQSIRSENADQIFTESIYVTQ